MDSLIRGLGESLDWLLALPKAPGKQRLGSWLSYGGQQREALCEVPALEQGTGRGAKARRAGTIREAEGTNIKGSALNPAQYEQLEKSVMGPSMDLALEFLVDLTLT